MSRDGSLPDGVSTRDLPGESHFEQVYEQNRVFIEQRAAEQLAHEAERRGSDANLHYLMWCRDCFSDNAKAEAICNRYVLMKLWALAEQECDSLRWQAIPASYSFVPPKAALQ